MWKELGWYINVEKDVATILKENGVDVDGGAIESIVWSRKSILAGSRQLVTELDAVRSPLGSRR
jgi:hypothetical protein